MNDIRGMSEVSVIDYRMSKRLRSWWMKARKKMNVKYSSWIYFYFQSASDYVNIALQEEKPMFTKQKVNFLPTKRITHMAVCNELVVIVMANTTLLYKSLKDPDNPKGLSWIFNLFEPTFFLSFLRINSVKFNKLLEFH